MTRLCLGCLLLVLVGCANENPVGKPSPPVPTAAVTAAVVPPSTNNPATQSFAESITIGGETKETARLWSDTIKTQLDQIAEVLVHGESTHTKTAAALAGQIELIDAQRYQVKETFQGPSVKVVELRVPSDLPVDKRIQAETDAFITTIQKLLQIRPNATEDSIHFKLFGIAGEGQQLKTRQRLTSLGTSSGTTVRSYGVVDATWILPSGDDQRPRLVGFSMPWLVRTELIAGAGGPESVIFEDIAGRVLGGNDAWHEQLLLGMNTWVRRIERSLSPDFLGYHGIAIRDVDGDELEDVYLCQPGGLPNLLLRQQRDGTFVDISAEAGVDWLDNSTGALLIDLDNDGDADLTVATRSAFVIMENEGEGRFRLRARHTNIGAGYSPTAADYDRDGDLDLLVLRYAATDGKTGDFPTPHPFHDARNGGANVLLQNQGEFRFTDVTQASGLGSNNHRFSFAASWEDYDNDGILDLYIANDFGPNQLFRNDGQHFSDKSVQSGTLDWGFGMSATWGDYDRDGNMDLYVSSMFSGAGNQIIAQSDFNPSMPEETRQKYMKMVRGNSLLRNAGQGRFSDVTNPMSEGFGGWAWGSVFADLDNDGWQDLYVANGYISQPDKEDL